MMRAKNNRSPYSLPFAITAINILLASNFAVLPANASSLWVEVHPPVLEKPDRGIKLIHFIDADTGWAETKGCHAEVRGRWQRQEIVLHTSDGGASWKPAPPIDDPLRFQMHFVSQTVGWRLRSHPEEGLLDDIELYHTTDGGLTWSVVRGEVTELIEMGIGLAKGIIEKGERGGYTHVHFLDERRGWLMGYTKDWTQIDHPAAGEFFGILPPLGGNFICSTRDGGGSWRCHVHVYITEAVFGNPIPWLRVPTDADFVNPNVGWIAPNDDWIYSTENGGTSWRLLRHPSWETLYEIDFVDESQGWLAGSDGVYFTSDGGLSWMRKDVGDQFALYADVNGVWTTNITRRNDQGELLFGIFHSTNNGDTWQMEWEGSFRITYIGYHPVTQSLWAGGKNGIILKRTISTTAVTPGGKLTTLWGKLKADPNTD